MSFPLPICSGWGPGDLSVPAEEKCAQGPVPSSVAKPGEDPPPLKVPSNPDSSIIPTFLPFSSYSSSKTVPCILPLPKD